MYERTNAIMPVGDESWGVVLEEANLGGEGPAMLKVRLVYQILEPGDPGEETVIGFILPTDTGVAVAPNHPDTIWETASDHDAALCLLAERMEELGLI